MYRRSIAPGHESWSWCLKLKWGAPSCVVRRLRLGVQAPQCNIYSEKNGYSLYWRRGGDLFQREAEKCGWCWIVMAGEWEAGLPNLLVCALIDIDFQRRFLFSSITSFKTLLSNVNSVHQHNVFICNDTSTTPACKLVFRRTANTDELSQTS